MIKLYGVPMSRAIRPLWMLEELGLEYEHVKIHFATGETRSPEFLKINPNGHIPALVDGDLTLCESMAINLYLARKYDQGLWPKSVEDEARTYQWSIWSMTEIEEPLVTAMVHRLLLPEDQREAAKADDAEQRFRKPLAVLDAALADRDYLLGDAFTVADLNVASVMLTASLGKIDIADAPNASAWLQRCTSRPAMARARQA